MLREGLVLRMTLRFLISTPGQMGQIREGNGTSLQYSCLENPMDRGAWWARVYRVTEEMDATE